MLLPSDRDWTEDSSHENGNYINTCVECQKGFFGHKRRGVCKKCSTEGCDVLPRCIHGVAAESYFPCEICSAIEDEVTCGE